jgi:glutamate decarboxylase
MQGLDATTAYLAKAVQDVGCFEILSKPGTVPLVCFRLRADAPGAPGAAKVGGDKGPGRAYTVFDISSHLRARGWIVPAYTLAPNAQDIAVLRVVVRENFSRDMADLLADDLRHTVQLLETHGPVHSGAPHAHAGSRPRIAAAAPVRHEPKAHKTARGVC